MHYRRGATTLAEIQAEAAAGHIDPAERPAGAIKTVQGDSFLGSDATTLVNDMQADITGLQALGTKIAADTTVSQAIADADLIFTEFRVYYVMLPVVHDVSHDRLHRQRGPARAEQGHHDAPGRGELFQPAIYRRHLSPACSPRSRSPPAPRRASSAQLLAYTPGGVGLEPPACSRRPKPRSRPPNRAVDYAVQRLGPGQRVPPFAPDYDHHDVRRPRPRRRPHTTTHDHDDHNVDCARVQLRRRRSAGPLSAARAGWPARNAPSSKADAPANALDGNLTTRFSTDEHQAAGLYFEVNLGSPQTFDELEMDVPNSPHDYARGYNVEVSGNGSSWTTVASCTGTGTPEIVSFPTQTAQYVEVVLTASNSYW